MKAQQYIPILWLRSIKSCFARIKDLWSLFRSGLFNEESCFPELPRKNKFQRAIQLIWYLLRYGEIMWQYNLYGLDVKPFKAIKEYIGNKELMWREYKYNVLMAKDDYTNILKDKRLFYLYLSANGYSTPSVYAYTDNGSIYPFGWRFSNPGETRSVIPVEDLLGRKGNYFCKPFDGICGRGVFLLTLDDEIRINREVFDRDSAQEYLSNAFNNKYVIQDVLVQHSAMSHLNPSSVNTIRIITGRTKKDKHVEFVTGFLRIGGERSFTDNMAGGGMAVGINFETGYLQHFGYLFDGKKSQRIEMHPVLKIPFDTIQIPHLQEAIESSIELHERLECIQFIGWDVAITEESVSFIEGNDNPGLSQSNHGPKRRVIDQYI